MNEQAQVLSARRRRSRAEVERLVAAYETSGLSQAEFCRQHALSLSTLSRYLQRRREAAAAGVNLLAVELRGAPAIAAQRDDSGLAIALAGGRRIEVARGFDAGTLVQLLGVLERF